MDALEQGQPNCSRYVAALARAVEKTAHIVLCHPLIITTEHGIAAYLAAGAFSFSNSRKVKICSTLRGAHITFRNTHTNMAVGVNDGTLPTHDCVELTRQAMRLRPDLSAVPLLDPDLEIFSDGCCHKGPEGNIASYGLVTWENGGSTDLESGQIPQPVSAQVAEIVALTRALQLSQGHLNIYTDSAYGHAAIHIDGPSWLRREFRTAAGTPVKHETYLKELVEAVKLPREVAVIKVQGHSKASSKTAKGNQAADKLAKKAGGYPQAVVLRSGKRCGTAERFGKQEAKTMEKEKVVDEEVREQTEECTDEDVEEGKDIESGSEEENAREFDDEEVTDAVDMFYEIQERASPQEKAQWLEYGAFRQEIPYKGV